MRPDSADAYQDCSGFSLNFCPSGTIVLARCDLHCPAASPPQRTPPIIRRSQAKTRSRQPER